MKDFSFDTVTDFDQHIRDSIPGYDVLVQQTLALAPNFVQPRTRVIDLGCSRGTLLNTLYTRLPASMKNRLIGYDLAENLLPPYEAHKGAAAGIVRETRLEFYKEDITQGIDVLPSKSASLIFAIFTLQFVSPSKKKHLLRDIFRALSPGGAFIVAEKNYMAEGYVQELFSYTLNDHKATNGFSVEDIAEKQKSLRTLMKPSREADNVAMLREAGFQVVESFFQALAFKAWVCIKTE